MCVVDRFPSGSQCFSRGNGMHSYSSALGVEEMQSMSPLEPGTLINADTALIAELYCSTWAR